MTKIYRGRTSAAKFHYGESLKLCAAFLLRRWIHRCCVCDVRPVSAELRLSRIQHCVVTVGRQEQSHNTCLSRPITKRAEKKFEKEGGTQTENDSSYIAAGFPDSSRYRSRQMQRKRGKTSRTAVLQVVSFFFPLVIPAHPQHYLAHLFLFSMPPGVQRQSRGRYGLNHDVDDQIMYARIHFRDANNSAGAKNVASLVLLDVMRILGDGKRLPRFYLRTRT